MYVSFRKTVIATRLLACMVAGGTIGLLGLTACGSDHATAPVSIVGTYTLSTVGGAAPPANVVLSGIPVTVTSGAIVFNANATFTETLSGTHLVNGEPTSVTAPSPGTYAIQGDAVVLTFSGGSGVTGSWDAHHVNVVDAGYSLVFTR